MDRRAIIARLLAVAALWSGLGALGCRRKAPPSAELWIGGDVNVSSGEDRLDPLRALLAGAVGVVNLEGPIADAPSPGEGVRLANAREGAEALRRAGVRVVGIANNHAGDAGPLGPARTAAEAASVGLLPAGGEAGPAVFENGGLRVAVTAHDLLSGVPASLDADLRAARARSDVLIATFHVTGPPSYLPTPELRAAVDIALAAGARVVAAHGSHALGPVERRGDAVIAWGLGNLVFSCECTDAIDGAVLRVSIDSASIRAHIIPIDAGLRGAPARPSHNAALIFDLLRAIGSSPIYAGDASASF